MYFLFHLYVYTSVLLRAKSKTKKDTSRESALCDTELALKMDTDVYNFRKDASLSFDWFCSNEPHLKQHCTTVDEIR